MKARALRQAAFALVALAGAMPAVHAQNDPNIEACVQYAEADVVFETAITAADAAYKSAEQEVEAATQKTWDAYKAAVKAAQHAARKAADKTADKTADKAVMRAPMAAFAAHEAAKQEANAARHETAKAADAAIDDARTVHTQAYLAIYAEGGGTQSDVWDVMVKLLNHQRNRCTQLFGL